MEPKFNWSRGAPKSSPNWSITNLSVHRNQTARLNQSFSSNAASTAQPAPTCACGQTERSPARTSTRGQDAFSPKSGTTFNGSQINRPWRVHSADCSTYSRAPLPPKASHRNPGALISSRRAGPPQPSRQSLHRDRAERRGSGGGGIELPSLRSLTFQNSSLLNLTPSARVRGSMSDRLRESSFD